MTYFMNMSNSSDRDTFSLYSSVIFSRIFSSSYMTNNGVGQGATR
jgi:hypothetical protein